MDNDQGSAAGEASGALKRIHTNAKSAGRFYRGTGDSTEGGRNPNPDPSNKARKFKQGSRWFGRDAPRSGSLLAQGIGRERTRWGGSQRRSRRANGDAEKSVGRRKG